VGKIDDRITERGLVLPPPLTPPAGVTLPFRGVHVVGAVAYISGHGPQWPAGELAGPFGKVGLDLDVEQGYLAARLTALSILASLRRTLGDLDRIAVWGRVFGMVNSAPGFTRQPEVINGFSDLILELFGPEVGAHARSAVGMAELPFGGVPVEIEGQVHLTGRPIHDG
jgi:enamine deaminase RidA (YjgF/YER057c/UK114 family)